METITDLLNLIFLIAATLFAYYRFFKEGAHQQRIQFDIEYVNLGTSGADRIVEIGIIASNKGYVEQRFDDIRLKVRGIVDGQKLTEIKSHPPRLSFPEKLEKISVIPKKLENTSGITKNSVPYFYVRPGVTQRFPVVLRVPTEWKQLHIRATFKYVKYDEIHNAERAFGFLDKT